MSEIRNDNFCVLFPATGQRFPIRYQQTSDHYEVELPCGLYGGEYLADLKRELILDFDKKNVKITKLEATK
jgi:hypothetical protein